MKVCPSFTTVKPAHKLNVYYFPSHLHSYMKASNGCSFNQCSINVHLQILPLLRKIAHFSLPVNRHLLPDPISQFNTLLSEVSIALMKLAKLIITSRKQKIDYKISTTPRLPYDYPQYLAHDSPLVSTFVFKLF